MLRGPNCEQVLELLQSYLDEELTDEEGRKVASHLADCRNCEIESSVYTQIKATLATRRRPVDPEIMDALRRFSDQLVATDISGPEPTSSS